MSQRKSDALTRHEAVPERDNAWQGFTLDELRYRRAYVAARCEMEKQRLGYNVNNLRDNTVGLAGSAVKRVAGAIPFVNYAVMGIGVAKKLYKIFGGKKRRK